MDILISKDSDCGKSSKNKCVNFPRMLGVKKEHKVLLITYKIYSTYTFRTATTKINEA